MDALGVGLGELALGVERGDGAHELGHGVKVGGEVVQHGHHVAREGRPGNKEKNKTVADKCMSPGDKI